MADRLTPERLSHIHRSAAYTASVEYRTVLEELFIDAVAHIGTLTADLAASQAREVGLRNLLEERPGFCAICGDEGNCPGMGLWKTCEPYAWSDRVADALALSAPDLGERP